MDNKIGKIAISVFCTALVVGWYMVKVTQTDIIYVDLGNGRGPAAIRQSFYVGGLNGLALSKKIHERVIGDAHVISRNGEMGIELGQFVTEGMRKQKVLACSLYDRIEMQFVGEGMATQGENPHMSIQSDCRISNNDINWMEPIWVPTEEILAKPTTMKQMSFLDKQAVSFQFENVGDEWPLTWVLENLRMYNSENPQFEINVSRAEIREISPKSIILEWATIKDN